MIGSRQLMLLFRHRVPRDVVTFHDIFVSFVKFDSGWISFQS